MLDLSEELLTQKTLLTSGSTTLRSFFIPLWRDVCVGVSSLPWQVIGKVKKFQEPGLDYIHPEIVKALDNVELS